MKKVIENIKDEKWLKRVLVEHNAVITGSHLVLTSGKHSDGYINLRVLAGKTDILIEIAKMLAISIKFHEAEVNTDNDRPIVIVGPETLGRTLAEFTAIAGGFSYFAWCDMKKGVVNDGLSKWRIKRFFQKFFRSFFGIQNEPNNEDEAIWNQKLNFQEIVKGSRCYIIDDLLTTAKSLKMAKKLIEETGGEVVGASVVVRRSPDVTAETIDIPWLEQLMDVDDLKIHDADDCPFCKQEIPIKLRPGHGHEWIKNNPGYPVEGRVNL